MTIGLITEVLADRKFKPCDSLEEGAYCFSGSILCNGEPVPIELEIRDFDFIVPPIIRVIERPSKLQGFQPHFGTNDELCYINKGMVYLDRYNPGGVVCGCLEKASTVLSVLASKNRCDDTHEEFSAYWNGEYIYIDCASKYEGVVSVAALKTAKDINIPLVSIDPDKRVKQLETIGWRCDFYNENNGYVLTSRVVPSVSGDVWPPKTLGQVTEWIKGYDKALYEKIYRQLASKWFIKSVKPFFILRTPSGDFGFRFTLNAKYKEQLGRKPSNFRNYLIGKGSSVNVTLLSGRKFDQNYIHSRNLLDKKNFRNKKILLAGCGTIGGYLASYLARLGAGLGNKGKLILCDPDNLNTENIGRHVLGMYALAENKAHSVRDLVLRDFPHLNVESRPADIRDVKELHNVDIVIDATGEEALSIALNEIFTQKRIAGNKTSDVLYVWTGGAGDVAQALMVDSLQTACYSCLYIRKPNGNVVERFKTLKTKGVKPGYVQVGCEGFMPFPVSASVQAASLAVEMMFDWVRGDPSPRFRTRVLNAKNSASPNDQDPSQLKDCPACQTR